MMDGWWRDSTILGRYGCKNYLGLAELFFACLRPNQFGRIRCSQAATRTALLCDGETTVFSVSSRNSNFFHELALSHNMDSCKSGYLPASARIPRLPSARYCDRIS